MEFTELGILARWIRKPDGSSQQCWWPRLLARQRHNSYVLALKNDATAETPLTADYKVKVERHLRPLLHPSS